MCPATGHPPPPDAAPTAESPHKPPPQKRYKPAPAQPPPPPERVGAPPEPTQSEGAVPCDLKDAPNRRSVASDPQNSLYSRPASPAWVGRSSAPCLRGGTGR